MVRSDIRVFKESGVKVAGKVLPMSEFKLFSDLEERVFDHDMAACIVAEAEKMLEQPLRIMTLSLYRDFFLTGVRSRFESVSRERENMALYLAMAEIYERRGRFVEKLADVIWLLLEQTEWNWPAHYCYSPMHSNSTVPMVYKDDIPPALELYSGGCCGFLSMIAYFLKDELDAISPVIVERIKHEVFLRGIRPYLSTTFNWMGETPGSFASNWVTNITQNILLATALTVDDICIREKVVERALKLLDNFTAAYPEDGSCDEGPGYWSGAPGNLFDSYEIIEDMTGGQIKMYDHPLIRKMGEYVVNFNIHDKYYITFADARPKLVQDGKMMMRYGKKAGSDDLYAFGKFLAYANSPNQFYVPSMAYRNLKNLYTPRPAEAQVTAAKPAYWYDGNKIAIFRENADTSKGLFLAVKGGTNGEAHNHNDIGCIVVSSDGKPLIVDPSHGTYDNGFFGPTRYYRWFMKSSYHSIPLINGVEQMAGRQYTSRDEVCDLEHRTVSMNLTDAFPSEAGIADMKRTCSLSDGVVTVKDEITLNEVGEIRFNYVVIDEPVKVADGELTVGTRHFDYDKEGVTLTVEPVENTYLPYDDLDFKSSWDRERLWRIVLTAKAKEKTLTVRIY